MTLSEKQSIFTYNIAQLITFAYSKGYKLTFGEAFRTQEQEQIDYDKGLSKTLNSRHTMRLAVDFNLFLNDHLLFTPCDYQFLGEYWMSLNTDNIWGGDWNRNHDTLDETFHDPYHFEMKP